MTLTERAPRRQPLTARLDDRGNRLYTWTGRGIVEEFFSSTTIINGGVPKFLAPWAAKLVAERAYDDVLARGVDVLNYWAEAGMAYLEEQRAGGMKLQRADTSPRGLALRYLKGEPDRIRDAAAERGSLIHEASEDFVLERAREGVRFYADTEQLPPFDADIAPHMQGLVNWLTDFRPRILATEATVFNRTESYAGTSDLFAEILKAGEWRRLCIDYKSGRAIYAEVAMQCASYARGEFIGGADLVSEHPVPDVAGTAVLHLNPKAPRGYVFRELRYDDVVWRAFLYAREIFRWAIDISKSALGEEIAPDLEDQLTASVEGAA